MGFDSLQHVRCRRSTISRVLPTHYVPPSGFGYPLGGFLPSTPCRLCFAPAALMGFTLRSVPLLRGALCVSTAADPPAVSPCTVSHRKRRAGMQSRDFWASVHRKSPLPKTMRLTPPRPDAPLGFSLSGQSGRRLVQANLNSSHLLERPRPPQHRVLQNTDLAPLDMHCCMTQRHNPLRVWRLPSFPIILAIRGVGL